MDSKPTAWVVQTEHPFLDWNGPIEGGTKRTPLYEVAVFKDHLRHVLIAFAHPKPSHEHYEWVNNASMFLQSIDEDWKKICQTCSRCGGRYDGIEPKCYCSMTG